MHTWEVSAYRTCLLSRPDCSYHNTDCNFLTIRELAELPYVKSCIALSSSKQAKGTAAASKGAKKERKYNKTIGSIDQSTHLLYLKYGCNEL